MDQQARKEMNLVLPLFSINTSLYYGHVWVLAALECREIFSPIMA